MNEIELKVLIGKLENSIKTILGVRRTLKKILTNLEKDKKKEIILWHNDKNKKRG